MTLEQIKQKIKESEYNFLVENEHLGDNIILLGLGGSHAYGTNIEKDEKYVSYDGKSDLVHLSSTWIIDKEIPIFKGDGRAYIEQLIYIDEKDY